MKISRNNDKALGLAGLLKSDDLVAEDVKIAVNLSSWFMCLGHFTLLFCKERYLWIIYIYIFKSAKTIISDHANYKI